VKVSAPTGAPHMKAGDSNDCGHPFAPTPAPASQSGGCGMDSGEPAEIRPHRISTASSRPHFVDAQHADTAAPPSYAYRCCAKARQLATHLQHIPIPVSNEGRIPGPWRNFRLRRMPVQLSFHFDDELPFQSAR